MPFALGIQGLWRHNLAVCFKCAKTMRDVTDSGEDACSGSLSVAVDWAAGPRGYCKKYCRYPKGAMWLIDGPFCSESVHILVTDLAELMKNNQSVSIIAYSHKVYRD